jgi:hypothetical protein
MLLALTVISMAGWTHESGDYRVGIFFTAVVLCLYHWSIIIIGHLKSGRSDTLDYVLCVFMLISISIIFLITAKNSVDFLIDIQNLSSMGCLQ